MVDTGTVGLNRGELLSAVGGVPTYSFTLGRPDGDGGRNHIGGAAIIARMEQRNLFDPIAIRNTAVGFGVNHRRDGSTLG